MLRSHKIRLNLNVAQQNTLLGYMGAARWVYNQTKQISEDHYKETGKGLTKYELRNKIVQELKPANPWLYEVPKGVTNYAVFNYHDALTNFFKGKSKYPKFHSRKEGSGSFSVENDKIKVEDKKLRIPLLGWVKMTEALRFQGKIKTFTVTQKNNKFYAAFVVDTEYTPLTQTGGAVGIDVNLSAIVDSNKNHYIQPRAYKAAERKLKLLQKKVSRKQKGSQNRKKAVFKLAKAHEKVANIRSDFAHKLSYDFIRNNSLIGIETLTISNMLKNKSLSKHISDAGFYQFLNNIKYKATMNERLVIEADRFYPSSKTCSKCKVVKTKLLLSERWFICENCGYEADRDENAAQNLLNYALAADFAESLNACGEDIRLEKNNLNQQSPVKQEPDSYFTKNKDKTGK